MSSVDFTVRIQNMGKTKTKIMDDSIQEEVKKSSKKEKRGGRLAPNAASSRSGEAGRTRGEAESEPQGVNTEGVVSEQESVSADQSDNQDADSKRKQTKTQKPGKAKPRSKKYQDITKDLNRSQSYPLTEAVDLVKKLSYSKFNGTLEAHINTATLGIRGLVFLPYVSGKKLKILVFGAKGEVTDAILGDEGTIEEIGTGKVNFDLVVTTPDWMPKLAKVARILGPRGLMPNPKNGTITSDLKKAIESFQAGKTEYKTEAKAPVIHIGLGKLNQPTEELSANIKTLLQTLGKTRVKKVALSPTIGPSIKVDLGSI